MTTKFSEGPAWVKGAVIYQIFPDRFARSAARKDGAFEAWDAPETQDGFKGGDLAGVEARLDHIQELGATAIYFNPVFASAANHRYHTFDYYQVDPVLGGNAALDSLLKAAHRRGLKVILDGVFNHASRGFFQFNHIMENGPASPYRDWFHVRSYPVKAYNLAGGEKPNYACWWELPALPKFNTDNPEVRRFIMAVGRYWLERGIDGWRLDVPNEINDDSFWREFRRTCRAANPDCYITGEIWGDAERWLAGDQFDAMMNYKLSAGCISYFGGHKLKLTHSYAGRDLKPLNQKRFIDGVERLLGQYRPQTTLVQMNMMTSHDTDRMLDTYGGDRARMRLAVVFTYLFPGAVNVYYGEELGLPGTFNAGTRQGMPWNNRNIWDKELLKLYRDLGALRRGNPVIRDGGFEFLKEYCDGRTLAFRRTLGRRSLTCFMNNSADTAAFTVKGRLPAPSLNGGARVSPSAGGTRLELPPYTWAVFGR